MKAHQIQASILELQQRSASSPIWLKAGHADPSIDRNHEKRIDELVTHSSHAEHAVESWHDAECVECSRPIRTRFGVGMCKECAAPYNAAYGDKNDSPASAVRAIKASRSKQS